MASYRADVSFTLSAGDDAKRVYVWYQRYGRNVSVAASDTITLNEKPVVSTFLVNGGAPRRRAV